MKGKPALLIGGLVAALAIPTGVAVAATTTPSPSPSTGTNPGYGPGMRYGRMMDGGYGDPQDCPFSDSTEAQQWRSQRQQRRTLEPAQRQKLMQQHREQMRNLRSRGATP